ncbi:DNA polymerase III subunit gamma/tau [Roseomonas sp. SSH11]|uniref:DNA polymerase III subunit gamma/tau n=1 Tax=Pararoseomonas baculiformis TaxID=2820812 RepID=A0ABS4AEL8_9PROT|nr:DNA polymerase III subunit gamma/tau [Pararoseomonas baculiformis]MBP0445426.1 DNA polymerase III subunit gamma/tau [Pararoseomonas baculiformis]
MTSDTDLSPESQDDLPEPPMEGPGLFGDPSPPPAASQTTTAPATAAPAPASVAEPSQPYRVLARKYRPQDFNDLIGQEALVRTLRNAFAQNRVAHAFMLTGVRGVGKTTTARIIARALNCIGPDGKGGPTADPCGVCPECRAILADRHPDVMELDAASNNGVENVREIREAVRFRPSQGRFKVYILDEVHMLSGAAFNALLKTLEEPPPQVKFLFATTEIRKVPATILSRCQRFDLKRVPQETLRAHFARIAEKEGASVEPEALAMIARAADGSVRDGLSLLDQAIAMPEAGGQVTAEGVRDMLGLADRALVLELMEAAMRGDLPALLAGMDRAHERGADPGVVLADMAELTHTLTRFRAVPALRTDPSIPEAERVRGGTLAETLTIPVLGRAWQVLLKGINEVAESPDRRAAAEMVLIRLAHLAEMPTPGEIVRRLSGAAPVPRGGPGPSLPNGGGNGAGPMADAVSGTAVAGAPAGGFRAIAGGAALRAVSPEAAPMPAVQPETEAAPAPLPTTFREVVALASGRKPFLHAHLVHSVHLVRFEARAEGGRIELRTLPDAPRDLAGQLSALLQEVTGTRWTVSLSNAQGEPTLAEQGRAAAVARLEVARSHPLVLAVMQAFPGAQIREVRDASLDAYGLPPPDVTGDGEPVGEDDIAFAPPDDDADFGFAPLDAEPAGMDRP